MPRGDPFAAHRWTASDRSVNPPCAGPEWCALTRAARDAGRVKVVLLAESFLPHMNGVTHSLLQVLRHLERRGDEALVVAPRSGPVDHGLHGARAAFLRSVPLPGYPEVRVTFASANRLAGVIREFEPDVMHLASPFVLGWQGLAAAEQLGVPTVAVYQTDIPAYADRYRLPGAAPMLASHVARIHRRATLTLAPSTSAVERLEGYGVERMRRWARGVDTDRFRPSRRSEAWRRRIAPNGEVVVGYVGRLAPEKQVEDLEAVAGLPGTRLVIVGDGPSRPELEALLPDAVFTGFLGGDDLPEAMAGFDVFVHPGESETFCQTIQEALASGVPVVATGRGGPLDLVHSSRDGWLYRPGDLEELAARVRDLVGDAAKRRAFGVAARAGVAGRSWERLGEELIGHYGEARELGAGAPFDRAKSIAPSTRETAASALPVHVAERAPTPAPARPFASRPGWHRFAALGDSITEGLCDTSRAPTGEYRGWADRLAMLLAVASSRRDLHYANLAVRSRRVADVLDEQLPHALAIGADLVSVLVGGNDLVRVAARPDALAGRLAAGIGAARAAGCDVLVVTPFLPAAPRLAPLRARFDRFSARLVDELGPHDPMLLDTRSLPALVADGMWAEDRVHLNPSGHRALAYAAAGVLGVPDAAALARLDAALHGEPDEPDAPPLPTAEWLRRHAAPWIARRARGRTAGDGRVAKHVDFVPVAPPGRDRARRSAAPG